MGEPFIPWQGVERKVFGQSWIYEPPKPWRKGTNGVYEPPRDVIKAIPGVILKEMERIKEYAWCCGAGGDVIDAYPDFAHWTASERIEEAKATGAEAIVTACPWCKRNFTDTLNESGERMKVYDIIELVEQAV
jgi:Fe-S oxidoreductase